jgi:pimeloyl-ACP methyl ester carboxylesterase
LALDILDHGDSEIPSGSISLPDHTDTIRGCYRQLRFISNVLVGHSVGVMMRMILAAEYPEDLRGLVLVDIAPFEHTGRRSRPPQPEYFRNEGEAASTLAFSTSDRIY